VFDSDDQDILIFLIYSLSTIMIFFHFKFLEGNFMGGKGARLWSAPGSTELRYATATT